MRVYAEIASAFPGMLSYRELRKLDYRELTVLGVEAKIKSYETTINQLTVARAALARPKDFERITSELKGELRTLRIGKKEAVKEAWASLKKRG